MSLNHPLCCGFMKVAIFTNFTVNPTYNIQSTKSTSEILHDEYDKLKGIFESNNFNTTYESYIKARQKVYDNILSLGKTYKVFKENLLTTFSEHEWDKLNDKQKNEHRIEN